MHGLAFSQQKIFVDLLATVSLPQTKYGNYELASKRIRMTQTPSHLSIVSLYIFEGRSVVQVKEGKGGDFYLASSS